MQKAMKCMYKLIFIVGLVCAGGFQTLRGADSRAAVEDFQKKVACLVSCATDYKKKFDALRSKSKKNNFLTRDLHNMAGGLLKEFPAERVKAFGLTPFKQRKIISQVFSTFSIFRRRTGNSPHDRPEGITQSIRYRLVAYCFDAFSFDDAESEWKNEVGFIVNQFLNLGKRISRASLFLLTAMNDCLSRSSTKDCPRKGEALLFCSTHLAGIESHRAACLVGADFTPKVPESLLLGGGSLDDKEMPVDGLLSAADRVDCDAELPGVNLEDGGLMSLLDGKFSPVEEKSDRPLRRSGRNKKRTRG